MTEKDKATHASGDKASSDAHCISHTGDRTVGEVWPRPAETRYYGRREARQVEAR